MTIQYIVTNSFSNLPHVEITESFENKTVLRIYLNKNVIPHSGIYILKIDPPIDKIDSMHIDLMSFQNTGHTIYAAHFLPGNNELTFRKMKNFNDRREIGDNFFNINSLAQQFDLQYARLASEEKKYFDQIYPFFPSNYLNLTKEEQFKLFFQLRQNLMFFKILMSHWQLSCHVLDILLKDIPNNRAEVMQSRLGQIFILNQLRRQLIPRDDRTRIPNVVQQQLVFAALQSVRNRERQRTPVVMPQLNAGPVTQKIEDNYLEGKLDVPQELFCTLSGQLFKRPVKIISKQKNVVYYFEKEYLITAVKQKPENPLNRDPLTVAEVENLPIDEEMVKKVEAFKNKFKQDNKSLLAGSPHPIPAVAPPVMPIPAAAAPQGLALVPPSNSGILHIQFNDNELIAKCKSLNYIELRDQLLSLITEIKGVDDLDKCYSIINHDEINKMLKKELGPNWIFGEEGNTKRWQSVAIALKDKAKDLVSKFEQQKKFIPESEHQIFVKIFNMPVTRWSSFSLIETNYLDPYMEVKNKLDGLNISQPRNTNQK